MGGERNLIKNFLVVNLHHHRIHNRKAHHEYLPHPPNDDRLDIQRRSFNDYN